MKHLVGRKADAVDDIEGIEGSLFHLGVEVFRIAVQFQDTHVLQRKVAVRPDFGQIEGIDAVVARLLFGHGLYLEKPARKIVPLDGFEQIALMRFAVFGDDGFRLGVGQIANALHRAQMELDPRAPVLGVVETVRVATESVHVAE